MVICMATKSILKNIDIKDKKPSKSLVIALEKAAGKQATDVHLSRTYEDVRVEKLRSILNLRDVFQDNIPEELPDEADLAMLAEIKLAPDCQEFISSDNAMKALGF